MLDNPYSGTRTYLKHVTELLNTSPFEETIQYANNIVSCSEKYLNGEITIEEFEQTVTAVEEDDFTALEIRRLNHMRQMLIVCMPMDRSN